MTKIQAEWIAGRVPGADVCFTGKQYYVRVYPSGTDVRIAIREEETTFQADPCELSLAVLNILRDYRLSIESALADARAAGILPQEGDRT